MISLPKQFYEELDRIKNHQILTLNQYDWNTIKDCRDTIIKFGNEIKYTFLYSHETITDLKYLNEIYKIIEDYNIDAIISTSTASTFYKSANPLTNLLMWRDVYTRDNISWNSGDGFNLFGKDFIHGKKINNNRKYKGILSVRKKTYVRDYLFSKNPKIEEGIVRYAEWPDFEENINEDIHQINEFPTMDSLMGEYSNSYFSFVVESEHGDEYGSFVSNLTEKTLIAILNGTIPIVLGGKHYIKELKDMGIKVWNDEFGFGIADYYSTNSIYKIDSFFNCIENVNKLSISEAKDYWIKNKKQIQDNYNLVSRVLFDINLI